MKLGLGISLAVGSKGAKTPTQKKVSNFKSRVIADGGVFEAKACLDAQLTILSNIE